MASNKGVFSLGGFILHGCLNCLTSPEAITAVGIASGGIGATLLGLASAITGNFASGHLGDLISLSKLQSRLNQSDPNKVNHDLERLFKEAAVMAVSFIKNLFIAELKKDPELLFGIPEKKEKKLSNRQNAFYKKMKRK